MTFGSKLKYFRHRCSITQAKLAELTGIHLVSIKRYETNKIMPTTPHLEKLADALGVSISAFEETDDLKTICNLQTYSDLMRLLIVLRKNHIISINGNRGEDGRLLPDTVTFSLAPLFAKFFCVQDKKGSAEEIQLSLKSPLILDNIVKWESIYAKYEYLSDKYKGDEDAKTFLKTLEDNLDQIELEMQFDPILLERVDGHITVKVTPELGNEDILSELREKAIAEELKKQSKNKR